MRILITGASGFIGQHLLRACQQQAHEVIACVRDPARSNKDVAQLTNQNQSQSLLSTVACDFSRDHTVEYWLPRLQQVDVVINAVGIIRQQGRKQSFDALHRDTPMALFAACEQAGVKQIIQISALGYAECADDYDLSHYHRSKKQADDFLATHFPDSQKLRWTILLPSVVYGPGAKSMAFFKAMAALPVIPLVGNGDQRLQPIYIDDLCRAVMLIINSRDYDQQRLTLIGSEAISMKQLFVSLRQWLGYKPALLIPVPYKLSLLMAGMAGLISNAPVDRDSVRMLQRGNMANVQTFIDTFGFKPRGFTEVLQQQPAQTPGQWHANLFFILPFLRISLGLMWIITGVVSAFIYPQADSYALLAQLGITSTLAPVALYGASAIDFLLGLAMLTQYHLRITGLIQIAMMLSYSLLLTLYLPHYWAHPFGPILKNLPLIAATLIIIGVRARISHECQFSNVSRP